MKKQLYEWLDEEIPALNWMTPREAAKTETKRERLIEILKDWENMEERKKTKGESYIDIDFLKDELGLSF